MEDREGERKERKARRTLKMEEGQIRRMKVVKLQGEEEEGVGGSM